MKRILLIFILIFTIIIPTIVFAKDNDTTYSYMASCIGLTYHYNIWNEYDETHIKDLFQKFTNRQLYNKLNLESIRLQKSINELKLNYITTSSGCNVYHYNTVGVLNTLYNGLIEREIIKEAILKNDTSFFKTYKYDCQRFTEGEILNDDIYYKQQIIENSKLEKQYKQVIDILNSDLLPKNLTKNISVYICPYTLLQRKISNVTYIGGYTGELRIPGREEFIVLSNPDPSYLIHELGHVFINDTLGSMTPDGLTYTNETLWSQYRSLYKDATPSNVWARNLNENIAEDFKVYTVRKFNQNSKYKLNYQFNTQKTTAFEYNEKFTPFINDIIKTYNPNTQVALPAVTIKYDGMLTPLSYNSNYQKSTLADTIELNIDTSSSFYKNFIILINGGNYGSASNNVIHLKFQDYYQFAVALKIGDKYCILYEQTIYHKNI